MRNTAKILRDLGKVLSETFRRQRELLCAESEYFWTDEAAPACIPSNARRPAPYQLSAPAFSRDLPYKADAPRFTCHGHRLSSLYRILNIQFSALPKSYQKTSWFHLSKNTQNSASARCQAIEGIVQ